jgi:hypothetical protein
MGHTMRGIEVVKSCVIGDQVSVTPGGVSAGQTSNLGTDPTRLLRIPDGSRDSAMSEFITVLTPAIVRSVGVERTSRS